VGGGIMGGPGLVAGLGVGALDGFSGGQAMEDDEVSGGDDGAAEALADGFFPGDGRPGGGPGGGELGAGTGAVAGGAEELWPVGLLLGSQGLRNEEQENQ